MLKRCSLIPVGALVAAAASVASADTWPMRQADAAHTGRASYSIPASRQNAQLFDALLWQKRSPGSPGSGTFGASTMVFFDGTGPGGTDVVVSGYHWPKGVQGMDRHTGKFLWGGLPSGGESIGEFSPAFSPSGTTVYVVNDATAGGAYPLGHPLMAFAASAGPGSYWHNGSNPNPGQLGGFSPTIAPDGRIFLHSWNDRPYAGTDTGSAINPAWAAATSNSTCYNDPVIDAARGRVITAGRGGTVLAYSLSNGAQLWSVAAGAGSDATGTIDPATGNTYIPAGFDDIYLIGLSGTGATLWSTPAPLIYDYIAGTNNPQRAQSAGCLSHDGQTFYFQTVSQQGDGRLYAVATASGAVKWSLNTLARGGEEHVSSPIVTPNGVVIVGNSRNGQYWAVRDDGVGPTVIDTLTVESPGTASSSATLAAEGTLYLPIRAAWTAGNGDGEAPTGNTENLFTAIDLRAGVGPTLPPPANQAGFIRNHAVLFTFTPVNDPGGLFDHYNVFRATQAFTNVQGMTPIGSITPRTATQYLDTTASNGVSYYYAITSVAIGGGQNTQAASIGPRTPRDETDLQVASISRTPRFERYDPSYTGTNVTEPSGFGPYFFTAATGLGSGQNASTPRWPTVGQQVTYTATIRNRGTNPWTTTLQGRWQVDGQTVSQPAQAASLQPGDTAAFTLVQTWDDQLHEITFTLLNSDARAGNNSIAGGSRSVAFLTFIDRSFIENFREITPQYPGAATDDVIDWLNRHMVRFNQLFAAAGTAKRVHYDILETLPDNSPDPSINTLPFAIFPFRYHVSDGHPRLSGYYNPADDTDYGLLHEMGHQLGLIDVYQLDVTPEMNQVSGRSYTGPDCLMRTCAPFLSESSAGAMTRWLNKAHGYFGQYLYATPAQTRLRILGLDGQPLANATVKAYQLIETSGIGKRIPNQIKFQGTTDAAGLITLPNVPINPQLAPTTFAGDSLQANPFGYIAVVGANGVMHFKVERDGFSDYAWLDITELNNAYNAGQTQTATFDKHVLLGGPVQTFPPADMAELNASSWYAWAQGGNATIANDTAQHTTGQASIRFQTDGGFDTLARYPGDRLARWDLSSVQSIRFWARAVNPNGAFQDGPRVRLISPGGHFEWSSPTTAINQALSGWTEFIIPIGGSGSWPRTTQGSPSLADINGIEIHADTWGAGFTLWLDGVRFDPPLCYANCDGSTLAPILNVNDYICFLNRFNSGDPYANCDNSTAAPTLNVNDFTCFMNRFAAGCP